MIEVLEISKRYGRKIIFENVSFNIQPGEQIALIGKNGCGKTTLLQMIAGITKPDTGKICCFGKNMSGTKVKAAKCCGYVPQGNPLFEELSVWDNLRFWSRGQKAVSKEVIKMTGLEDSIHEKVEHLSGGMKRRLSIACAMLSFPPVMLMDEPTASLDIHAKEQIYQWMENYRKMHGTLLMVTHDREEIERCDRQLLVEDYGVREVRKERK